MVPMHAFVSGFAMVDGTVTASYLMDLKLPNAFFAFLSACESAMGDQVRSNLTERGFTNQRQLGNKESARRNASPRGDDDVRWI
jgi:hypothetical protein